MSEQSVDMATDGRESNLVCRSILKDVVDHSTESKTPEVISIDDDDDEVEKDPLSLSDSDMIETSKNCLSVPVEHSPPSPCSTITILSDSDGEDVPLSNLSRNKRPYQPYRLNSFREVTRASRCFVRADPWEVHGYIQERSKFLKVDLKQRLSESVIKSWTKTNEIEPDVEVVPQVEEHSVEQSESSNPEFENGTCSSKAQVFEQPQSTPRKPGPKRLTDVSPNEINKLLSITDGSPIHGRLHLTSWMKLPDKLEFKLFTLGQSCQIGSH